MKNGVIIFITAVLCLTLSGLHAQAVLDIYNQYSVQRMSDGKTFRILEDTAEYELMTQNIRFTFNEIGSEDTVVWQFVPEEDQLYVLAWNPQNTHKKYTAKLAVLWRVTSGNPRFGSTTVPADFQFEGFGKSSAFFINEATKEAFELYFYEHYNPGISTIDYTLKGRKNGPDGRMVGPAYYTRFNWDYADRVIPHPNSPSRRKAQKEREEFVRDSSLSMPLLAIKTRYQRETRDNNWGSPRLQLTEVRDSFVWKSNRAVAQEIHLFIPDAYYTSNYIPLLFTCEHPEIVPDLTSSLTEFSHKDGIREFRLLLRNLSGISCKIQLDAKQPFPVFLAEYDAWPTADLKSFRSPADYYSQNKTVQAIAASSDPYRYFHTLWAKYALENKIRLNGEDLCFGIRSVYERDGIVLDRQEDFESRPQQNRSGTVNAKFKDFFFVVVDVAPPALRIRPSTGSYQWIDITFDSLDRLPNQDYRVYISRVNFPDGSKSYDYEFRIDSDSPPVYLMLMSEPGGKK